MNKILVATTFLALTAAPALAQSDPATTNADTAKSSASSASTPMSTADMVASQDKVLKALKDAGYQDATIMDAAYMIQAKTPAGEQVMMMIDTSGRVMGASKANGSTASDANTDSATKDPSGSDGSSKPK